MKRLMVRYKVKAERAAENESYIRKVFEQLKSSQPPSFVHIVSMETSDGSNPLGELSAFKAFTSQIKDRCEEPPAAVELTEVGSYRFFSP